MTIGLEHKQLQKLFNEKWENYFREKSEMFRISLPSAFEMEGFDRTQANALGKEIAKMVAKTEAILEVIHLNNLKIESQLKQKGVQL